MMATLGLPRVFGAFCQAECEEQRGIENANGGLRQKPRRQWTRHSNTDSNVLTKFSCEQTCVSKINIYSSLMAWYTSLMVRATLLPPKKRKEKKRALIHIINSSRPSSLPIIIIKEGQYHEVWRQTAVYSVRCAWYQKMTGSVTDAKSPNIRFPPPIHRPPNHPH